MSKCQLDEAVTYSLVVGEGLLDLIPLNTPVLDPRLVLPHPRDHQELLVVAEAPDGRRRVRQKDAEYDTPCSSCQHLNGDAETGVRRTSCAGRADDEELESEGCQTGLDLADTVADQTTARDANTVEGVPRRDARGLLRSGVVHRRDEHESDGQLGSRPSYKVQYSRRIGNGLKSAR